MTTIQEHELLNSENSERVIVTADDDSRFKEDVKIIDKIIYHNLSQTNSKWVTSRQFEKKEIKNDDGIFEVYNQSISDNSDMITMAKRIKTQQGLNLLALEVALHPREVYLEVLKSVSGKFIDYSVYDDTIYNIVQACWHTPSLYRVIADLISKVSSHYALDKILLYLESVGCSGNLTTAIYKRAEEL